VRLMPISSPGWRLGVGQARREVKHKLFDRRSFLMNSPYTLASGFFPEGFEGPSPRW
jgi:hypothetical protein